MHWGEVLLVARSVPRALKVTAAVIGVLFGLSGALAVAALVKAADVASAYDRLVDATDGPDLFLASRERDTDRLVRDLDGLDGIEAVASLTVFEVAAFTADDDPSALGPVPDDPCATGSGDVAATLNNDGWRGRAPQMLLVEGRFPEADALEAVLPTVTAERLDLHVGDHVVFAGDCAAEQSPEFEEPIEVRISGLGTSVFDAPALGANFAIENLLVSPRVVDELLERGTLPNEYAAMWFAGGAGIGGADELPDDAEVALDMSEVRTAVRGDLRPDATALRLFSGIVATSALVILGPMLGRLVRFSNAAAPTLRSLGMTSRALVWVTLIRGAAVGLVVAIVAAGTAGSLSTRLPTGAAEQLEGAVSFAPGVVRAAAGSLAVAAVAVAITGIVAWAQVRARRAAGPRRRERALGRVLVHLGLHPSSAAGVRFALEPGSLDDPTPSRSGLTTAAIAVAAVAGVITFTSSVSHLSDTPRLYGVNWDAFALVEDLEPLAASLEADPEVTALARGTFFPPQGITLGNERADVWLMSFEAGVGRVEPSVASGRAPADDDEIMLSRQLSSDVDAGIGDVVALQILAHEAMVAAALEQPWNGPQERVVELEVVAIGVLPIGDGRVDMGASMTLEGLRAALGPTTSPEMLQMVAGAKPDVLLRVLRENSDSTLTAGDLATMPTDEALARLVSPFAPEILVFDAGGDHSAAEKAVAASNGSLSYDDFPEPTPETVINLDLTSASRIPDTFSGLMGVIAIVLVTTMIASGGRQRRHDLAILRALGFSPSHVRRALAAQAIATLIVACALVPVGVAAGRVAWLAYAQGLGVVPQADVGVGYLAAAVGALLVISLVVAMAAASVQARTSLAELLRAGE